MNESNNIGQPSSANAEIPAAEIGNAETVTSDSLNSANAESEVNESSPDTVSRSSKTLTEKEYEIIADFTVQESEARKIYPAFDLKEELKNPRFASLLESPEIDMRTAYEIIHRDEIIPNLIKSTAKYIEEKFADKLRSNASRPTENGNMASSTAVSKFDVEKLTRSERRAIAKRVMMGETVRF